MKYFPYENYRLKSKLSLKEIQSRIDNNVEPEKFFRFSVRGSNSTKPYEGTVDSSNFKMSRIIGYKNSFLPVIKGEIHSDFGRTVIHVRMRMHVFVCVFMTVWLGVAALASIGVLVAQISDRQFMPALLIPIGMFAFGYALMTGSFKYESSRSKKFLADLFEGEIENADNK